MRVHLLGLFILASTTGCSSINFKGCPSQVQKPEDGVVPSKDKAISVSINPAHGYTNSPSGPQYSQNKGIGINWTGLSLSR